MKVDENDVFGMPDRASARTDTMEESMNYSEFKMYLISNISERVGDSAQVSIRKVPKNNGVSLDGLTIHYNGRNIAPTIYLDFYWQKYTEGYSEDDIVEMIIFENKYYSIERNLDVDKFMDFDRLRDKIMYKLINYDMNRAYLDTVPMRRMLDLAVVYYYRVDEEELLGATCVIRNEDIERWGVSEEDLWELASVNTPREEPARIRGLCECICDYYAMDPENEMFQSDAEEVLYMAGRAPMHILSNESQIFGAACLLYPETMKILSDKFGADLYVLPSSVHEVILMPISDDYNSADLSEMVHDINESEVLPQEVLSDHVYRYCADRGVIRL